MEAFLIYIGKAALAAGAFFLVYLALFQHQKHFVFNRIYLPVSLAASFLIPLITFTTIQYIQPVQTSYTNSFAYLPEAMEITQTEFVYQWYHYLFAIYVLGIAGFMLHLLLGHLKAFSIIRYSRLKELFGAQVNLTQKDVHPFSFFNKIVISEKTLNNPNLEIIVNHEMVHVREKHTHDILFAEILFLLQWFNPFAWLIKDAIRNNLEYLTDHQITKTNNAEAYQLAMVGLAHKKEVAPFLTALNGSQLKNRIIMMKKKTENKYALLKQLVVLPLLAILVMGLSNKEVKTEIVQKEKHELNENQIIHIVNSQNTIHGIIKNQYSNLPVSGANIKIETHNAHVISDTNGKYELRFGKNNKPVIVEVSADGYHTNNVVYYGTNPDMNIVLTPHENTNNTEITVKGKVIDKNGDPIAAATVLVKGTTTGTITDMQGNYEIKTDENSTLVFAMIGYVQKEVSVEGDTEINATLEKVVETKNGQTIIHVTGKSENNEEYSRQRKVDFETGEVTEVVLNTITGKVTNKKGEALPGTAVLLKGTTTGTITDMSGEYSLQIPAKSNLSLTFAMVGYLKKEVKYEEQPNINIELKASAKQKTVNPSNVIFTSHFKVYGKVIDENGKPISAASIIVKGKNTGTVTDEKGKYSLVLDSRNEILVFGKPGFVSKKSMIADNEINITLRTANSNSANEEYDINTPNPNPINIAVGYPSPTNGAHSLKGKKYPSNYTNDFDRITSKKNKSGAVKFKISGDTKNQPLYVVDGKEFTSDLDHLQPDDIENMSVLKGENATALYGEKAKNGVIIITTKANAQKSLGKALVMVDGQKYNGNINDINTEGIEKIEVLKNESVTKLYGPEAKDGVIIIETKNRVDFGDKPPLIFVDGLLYNGDLNDFPSEMIKSIDVLKGASALKYDPTAKNGVILISTKPDKISSQLELRKFIASKIKYPREAQKANKEGIAQLFVKVNSDGVIYSISEKSTNDAIFIDEVVAVAYRPKPEDIVISDQIEDLSNVFAYQAKSVLNQLPRLEIPEYKGKTIAFTVKFLLQDKE
uniref:carboxypeptidase-like regulatory domain-containing protein n=1 Tax=uncultured Draconibacterium sp. TaxID=1573823 RepID=UPI0032177E52